MHVLLLGGTTEASQLAQALARAGVPATFSYAGRTAQPIAQPLPTRVGGFGGPDGLAAFLRQQRITHVIDATHPFAAQMSRHAIEACARLGVPLLALQRPPWRPGPGDRWHSVPDFDAAVRALPTAPSRVFLAIGRQQVQPFLQHTPHWYLLRIVEPGLEVPTQRGAVVVQRGPYTLEGDLALLRTHRIEWVVAKNSGGEGGQAKLLAARALGLPVLLIERPTLPPRPLVETVAEALQWLGLPAQEGHANLNTGPSAHAPAA
ncbi:cobalt-precorrin-6A reductase [Tepidimonas sp. HKU79]|uniref:cobalt-precorrin-6A reductase n=1 Tax=unclassified Tepidimonas TaxID=2631705 RepID=UPI003C79DF9C